MLMERTPAEIDELARRYRAEQAGVEMELNVDEHAFLAAMHRAQQTLQRLSKRLKDAQIRHQAERFFYGRPIAITPGGNLIMAKATKKAAKTARTAKPRATKKAAKRSTKKAAKKATQRTRKEA
jgi:hypothetical protein